MTKKRFVDYFDKDHNYIIQDLVNEDEYQVGFVNCDEDKFLELVNALAETSCDCITDCEIVMKKLKDENEQLKKQLNDIQNYINDTINENEEAMEWGKRNGADIGSMGFYTLMLKMMRKDWFE